MAGGVAFFPGRARVSPPGQCEYALRRLDEDAAEEKAKCERLEKALADYQQQLNQPFEHEERLRELCLKQQEINKLLDSTGRRAGSSE